MVHKTYSPKKQDMQRTWHLVDLDGKTLGKSASLIAHYLRGKHKPEFSPHVDCGDYVVVINAEKLKVTGKKLIDKIYYFHSGYMGNLRQASLKERLEKHPKRIIKEAVSGMIPRNKIKKQVLSKLKIFVGPEHDHEAQKPTELTPK